MPIFLQHPLSKGLYQRRQFPGKVFSHLDHAVIRGMEQVDGQIADVLEDIGAFEKMNIGVRTGCNHVPQFLPVFFRAPLLISFIERIIKITMVRIDGADKW